MRDHGEACRGRDIVVGAHLPVSGPEATARAVDLVTRYGVELPAAGGSALLRVQRPAPERA